MLHKYLTKEYPFSLDEKKTYCGAENNVDKMRQWDLVKLVFITLDIEN